MRVDLSTSRKSLGSRFFLLPKKVVGSTGSRRWAQQEGRRFLEQLIRGERDAFRRYVENLAEWIRRYPLRNAPLDEKIREQEEGTHLLAAVKWRWR